MKVEFREQQLLKLLRFQGREVTPTPGPSCSTHKRKSKVLSRKAQTKPLHLAILSQGENGLLSKSTPFVSPL